MRTTANGNLRNNFARRNLDQFPPDQFDAIITNAGGCGSHLKHFSKLLADDPAYRDRAALWDKKVKDIHEWLVEIGCQVKDATRPASSPDTRTWHLILLSLLITIPAICVMARKSLRNRANCCVPFPV